MLRLLLLFWGLAVFGAGKINLMLDIGPIVDTDLILTEFKLGAWQEEDSCVAISGDSFYKSSVRGVYFDKDYVISVKDLNSLVLFDNAASCVLVKVVNINAAKCDTIGFGVEINNYQVKSIVDRSDYHLGC